jgi:hypothetical protein
MYIAAHLCRGYLRHVTSKAYDLPIMARYLLDQIDGECITNCMIEKLMEFIIA